ncbi:hypothetical protein ACWN8P_10055 [Vagococcus salmoninarum]|uniref:hypothetical protein n=1 Tax=Vagococcus salmoninarum TaxID=2739 RepID=UPI001B8853C0|nr:hypothetical protein [Vagococcus salmoninarum]
MKYIEIENAHVNNLKNINIRIPKQELVVITGISGSGKSSLAFDLIFEEGRKKICNRLVWHWTLGKTTILALLA